MITKESILSKYCISEEEFQDCEMTWEDLLYIYNDFAGAKEEHYKKVMEDFISEYLKDINKNHRLSVGKEVHVHSIHYRVKDAEHLIVKIIRKKRENNVKYKNLTRYNYEKFVMDLIGIRCLILFKDEWENIHSYITSEFENNDKCYIKDPIRDFDEDIHHRYIAEKPKVHIRNGDSRKQYEKIFSPSCVIDDKVYRSIHYIIKYKGVYLELQVRTIFEEGWGEIDHSIVYPYFQGDPLLSEYTELLNRLAGLADEMGTFFHSLKMQEIKYLESDGSKPRNSKGAVREEIQQNNVIIDGVTETSVNLQYRENSGTALNCRDRVIWE